VAAPSRKLPRPEVIERSVVEYWNISEIGTIPADGLEVGRPVRSNAISGGGVRPRSPTTSPVNSSGQVTSNFMRGSRRMSLPCVHISFHASRAAAWKAMSLEVDRVCTLP